MPVTLRLAILDQSISGHNLDGRDNDDFIAGGQGNDRIRGFGGDDILRGEQGHDIINGGDGDDVIIPGLGRDTANGGNGNDTYFVEVGADKAGIGGPGDSDTAHLVSGLERFSNDPWFGTDTNLKTETTKYNAPQDTMEKIGDSVINMMGQKYWSSNYNRYADRVLRKPDGTPGLSEFFFEVNGGHFTHREQKWNHANGGRTHLNNAKYVLIGKKVIDRGTEHKGPTNGGIVHSSEERFAYYNVEHDTLLFTTIYIHNGRHDNDTFQYRFIGNASKVMYDHLINSSNQSANELDWGRSFAYMLAARHGHLNHETDISGTENVIGTAFRDNITGNSANNYLDGGKNRAGSWGDNINGGGGDDVIVVNNINDLASGDGGSNTLINRIAGKGQSATHRLFASQLGIVEQSNIETTFNGETSPSFVFFDRLITGEGNDTVQGDDRVNRVNTGAGTNTIHAGAGNDILEAGKNSTNTFYGEDGNDLFDLRAKKSTTTAIGSTGEDTFLGGAGAASIDGGEGLDTYIYQGSGRLFLDLEKSENQITQDLQYDANSANNILSTVSGVERFIGGNGWDVMKGDSSKNILNGGGVVDNIFGRGGDDVFVVDTINKHDKNLLSGGHKGQYHGGDGTDTVNYEDLDPADYTKQSAPRMTINLGGENGVVGETVLNTAEKGDQTLHSLNGIENAIGTTGIDTIYGNSEDNVLDGLEGDEDIIYGYGGNDTLSAKGGVLSGGRGHDTYLIRRDSRNISLVDIDLQEADRIVFDGVSMAEVKLALGTDGFTGKDVLSFQIEENGQMVTLANWVLPDDSVTNDSWQPLFKSVASGLYNISFVDQEKEGESSRDSVTLDTPREITAFLYDRLVSATRAETWGGKIQDDRGRDIQLTKADLTTKGTSGSDILRAGVEDYKNSSLGYRVHGGEGSDMLINSAGLQQETEFHLTDDDTLDGRLGKGKIWLKSAGEMDTTNVILGEESGSYSLHQSYEGSIVNQRGLNLILDGDIDLLKAVDGDRLVLSNDSTLDLFDNDKLAFDSIRFTESEFNNGEAVGINNRSDLNQLIQQIAAFKASEEDGDAGSIADTSRTNDPLVNLSASALA